MCTLRQAPAFFLGAAAVATVMLMTKDQHWWTESAVSFGTRPILLRRPRVNRVQQVKQQLLDPVYLLQHERHERQRELVAPWVLGIPDMAPEEFFAAMLLPRVTQRSTVIDVGANIGQFALTIAKLGHNGICFEPAPSTCRQLKANVANASAAGTRALNISIHCAAVGANEGSIEFSLGADKHASFSIATGRNSTGHRIRVPIERIDRVVGEGALDIVLLKSDTQGFEMGVLKGAERLLRSGAVPFLMVEMSWVLLHQAGSSPLELMEYVTGLGYACSWTQIFGVTFLKPVRKFGKLGNRSVPGWIAERSMPSVSFKKMDELLHSVGRFNAPGWTDLFCWRASRSTLEKNVPLIYRFLHAGRV